VKDGIVVGEGWHRRAGESHAEVLAIADTSQPRNQLTNQPPANQQTNDANQAQD
jgi:pyrimidine deaminase RibD-like protein